MVVSRGLAVVEKEGTMTLSRDGILAAVAREEELMPTTKRGKEITAWNRRGRTLIDLVDEVERLATQVQDLEEALKSRPF